MSQYLDGGSASSLFETNLCTHFKKETHVYSPVFRDDDIYLILSNCDHIIFNSFSQFLKYHKLINNKYRHVSPGIRINPQLLSEIVEKYNPCKQFSHLGVIADHMDDNLMTNIEGLHLHALCDQGADEFVDLIHAVYYKFEKYLRTVKWINFGGGHDIANKDYINDSLKESIDRLKKQYTLDIYIEPCESIVTGCGYLISSDQDVVTNSEKIAILDASAICHAPDIIEMPYIPDIIYPKTSKTGSNKYILAGISCMPGDIFGQYNFIDRINIGDRIVFSDMGAYTIAKENYFNGINHIPIYIYYSDNHYELLRNYTYVDYISNFLQNGVIK